MKNALQPKNRFLGSSFYRFLRKWPIIVKVIGLFFMGVLNCLIMSGFVSWCNMIHPAGRYKKGELLSCLSCLIS